MSNQSMEALSPPEWGPWLGVPRPLRHICAVMDCAQEGKPQVCPFDGRYHHHGCIHYERGDRRYPELHFREGWGWLCNKHYAIIREAAARPGVGPV